MFLVPSLKWVGKFCDSMGLAMDQTLHYTIEATQNPLIHKLIIKTNPPLSGQNKMIIWNLLQIFAYGNGCGIANETAELGDIWVLDVMSSRRLGPNRDKHPLE